MRKIFATIFLLTSFFLLLPFKALAVAGNTMGLEGKGIEGREGIEATRQGLIATRSATRQNIIQQRQQIHTQFLEKLNTIRDARKKQIVENLENRMNEINKKRTDEMLKHLEKMAAILDRIANSKFEIRNSKLDETIAAARAAIAAAVMAVQAQAGRTYTPAVTDETTLRLVTGQSVSQLQADLKTVREKVLLAKKAVMDAYLALVKAKGSVSVTPVASGSGNTR